MFNGSRINSIFLYITLSLFLTLLTSCTLGKRNANVDEIKNSNKVIIGTSANFPPYEFKKVINGKEQIVGIDILIAEEIAKELGVELEIKDMPFSQLFEALNSGEVDMVLAALNPSLERSNDAEFSKVYMNYVNHFIIQKDTEKEYLDMQDFRYASIAVQKGTVQEEFLRSNLPEAKIHSYLTSDEVIESLNQENVFTAVLEYPLANHYAKKHGNLLISNAILPKDIIEKGAAVAVAKGKIDLVDLINKTIDRLTEQGKIAEFIVKSTLMMN